MRLPRWNFREPTKRIQIHPEQFTSNPPQVVEKKVEFTLTLEPLETVLLVFQPEKITRPMRIEPDTKPIREPIAPTRYCNRPWEQPMPDMKRHPLTLSPVKAADPFRSGVTLPADVDLTKCRVYLQMDDLPDNSAAVTVNGVKAGGLMGQAIAIERYGPPQAG